MSSQLSPGQIVAGRYRVETQIGEGGMGVVYLVRHVHTDEKLALKVLHAQALRDATAVERFRREARAPAQIASEHVARVTDADTAADLDGAPFYVMEYLQGKDLEAVIKEQGALPPATVVEYLRQVARALDKAHGMGIVHRDLKPENLFLAERDDGSPCIKLLDFGIARLAGGDLPAHLKTQAGVMFGTPAYMSPEQMEGDLERVGPPTDVWSLGLIAFKLLVGQDFWTGNSIAVVCAQVLSIPMPTPTIRGSVHGPGFDAWFATCASRDVGVRYKSAGEAVAALADALGVPLAQRRSALSVVDGPEAPPPSLPFATTVGANPSGAVAQTLAGVAPPSIAGVSPPSTAGASPGSAPARSPAPPAPGPPPPVQNPAPAAAAGGDGAEDPTAGAGSSRMGVYLAAGTALLVGLAIAGFVVFTGDPATQEGQLAGSASAVPSAAEAPPPATSAEAGTPAGAGSAPEPDASAALSAGAAPSAQPPPSTGATGPRPTGWPAGAKPPDSPNTAPTAPPPPATTPAKPPPAPPAGGKAPSSDQRARLASLQRLCDQGLLTPAECAAKRQAILQGGP